MNPVALLSGLRLLVVEDETMLAMMLEDMLDGFGCVVVDVAGTLSRGLVLAGDEALSLDGAILDVNLGGEKVYPVAERLTARGVPFIFCTGYGPDGLAAKFAHVPTLAKPYQQEDLENMLVSVMAHAPRR
ncbi:MAG TPA: response regulator [Caulobacteraceae bacterium]|jgi:CheY-like chemotaxis protein